MERVVPKYEFLIWIVFFFAYCGIAFLLSNCTSNKAIYERGPLVNWELRPRQGAKGLTSLRCVKWKDEKCIEKDLVDFDLSRDEDRLRLHAARFVCRVDQDPKPLYRICKQLHGLCQQTEVTTGSWFNRKTEIKLINFINFETKYQYVLDKGVVCLSLDNPLSAEL